MRLRNLVIIFCGVLLTVAMLNAGANKFGVADTQRVSFTAATQVGDVVLPKGDYRVEHTMKGEEHVMIFTQQHTSKPAETRVKCKLVPLQSKAVQSQIVYTEEGETRKLQEMIFAGDTAKHVF